MFLIEIAHKKFICSECGDIFQARSTVAWNPPVGYKPNCYKDARPEKKYCLNCAEEYMIENAKPRYFHDEIKYMTKAKKTVDEIVLIIKAEGFNIKKHSIVTYKTKNGIKRKP